MKLWFVNSLNTFQGRGHCSDIKSGGLAVVMIIRRCSDLGDMAGCQVESSIRPDDKNLRVMNSMKPLQSNFL